MGENKQPLFSLYWMEEHYQRSLSLKELEIGFLEEEDQQTFRNLCTFVERGGVPIHCKDVIVASRQDQATCLCRALSFITECCVPAFYAGYFLAFINKCVLVFVAEIMANYAIQKQKRDAKGKGKVIPSGPPPSPAPVPAPISVVPTGINISDVAPAGGASPAKRSIPPPSGAEVANMQQKRRRTTKSGMLFIFWDL
jgi:hypothetical protein